MSVFIRVDAKVKLTRRERKFAQRHHSRHCAQFHHAVVALSAGSFVFITPNEVEFFYELVRAEKQWCGLPLRVLALQEDDLVSFCVKSVVVLGLDKNDWRLYAVHKADARNCTPKQFVVLDLLLENLLVNILVHVRPIHEFKQLFQFVGVFCHLRVH